MLMIVESTVFLISLHQFLFVAVVVPICVIIRLSIDPMSFTSIVCGSRSQPYVKRFVWSKICCVDKLF